MGLWQQAASDTEQKCWVCAADDFHKVIFEGQNVPLCGVLEMDIGGYGLEVDHFKSKSALECRRVLVDNIF